VDAMSEGGAGQGFTEGETAAYPKRGGKLPGKSKRRLRDSVKKPESYPRKVLRGVSAAV
jgi:hypothetical protein